jgi:LacI family transcriptional regulator
MAQSKITQQVIADKLNVSVPTVSKALNDHPDVNSETHTRIIDMANKLGYNSPGRSKQQQTVTSEKHHIICVFVTVNSEQYEDINYFAGMSSTYAKMNISLLFHYCSAEESELILSPEYQPPAMRDKLLSGAILVNQWPPKVVKELSSRIPCVSIINDFPETKIDVVGIDENEGISKLMDHLHQLGHRKIGFFTADGKTNQNLSRFGAYTASVYRLGLDYEPDYVSGMSGEILEDKTDTWNLQIKQVVEQIRRGVRAWMCTSNRDGYELYRVLSNWDFNIPKDVSITGFGDGDKGRPGWLKLPGMDVPNLNVGAEAVRRLVNRLHHPTSPQLKVKLPCRFNKGQTTAPPPKDI